MQKRCRKMKKHTFSCKFFAHKLNKEKQDKNKEMRFLLLCFAFVCFKKALSVEYCSIKHKGKRSFFRQNIRLLSVLMDYATSFALNCGL